MFQRVFKFISVCAISLSIVSTMLPSYAFAQAASSTSETSKGGPRRQLATIIFAGLGGAVLGLSTLSFYGRPQDKLDNIAIGFALGVIVGTGYITYKAATSPAEFYSEKPQLEPEQIVATRDSVIPRQKPLGLNMGWEF